MTAYELCKFCRDNNVTVEISPDWVVDYSQAITMHKDPKDGTPKLNYRYVLYDHWSEDAAEKVIEIVLENGLNAINKIIQEGGKNGE